MKIAYKILVGNLKRKYYLGVLGLDVIFVLYMHFTEMRVTD
jgi:hypothetical protein